MDILSETQLETYIVTADTLTSEGKGVARLPEESGKDKGMAVFCEGLLPGEKAEIRIVSRKKGYAEAVIEKLLNPASMRVTPFCSAFDTCGGCSMQHMRYSSQLVAKRRYIISCLSRIGKLPLADADKLVATTVGMANPFDYRNHMQYPVAETVTSTTTAATATELTDVEEESQPLGRDQEIDIRTDEPRAGCDREIDTRTDGKSIGRDLRIGLYAEHSHDIVPHNVCRIAHPACESVRKFTERFLLARGIYGYDEMTGFGFLRHLIVRIGAETGEVMILLVTAETPDPAVKFPSHTFVDEANRRLDKDRKRLLRELSAEGAQSKNGPTFSRKQLEKPWIIKSLFLTRGAAPEISGGLSRAAAPADLIHLWGEKIITETIGDRTYQISPLSFFQVNTEQTRILYDTVRRYAQDAIRLEKPGPRQDSPAPTCPEEKWPVDYAETGLSQPSNSCDSAPRIPILLDLYCGTGTIGLYLSDIADQILGAESNEGAVLDACKNAELNNVTTARYRACRAENLKPDDFPGEKSLIILDPPRKGCEKPLINTVLRLAPSHIIYVSCDPATLARDAALLMADGYVIKAATPVDMFPWTSHVETVVLLTRIK